MAAAVSTQQSSTGPCSPLSSDGAAAEDGQGYACLLGDVLQVRVACVAGWHQSKHAGTMMPCQHAWHAPRHAVAGSVKSSLVKVRSLSGAKECLELMLSERAL